MYLRNKKLNSFDPIKIYKKLYKIFNSCKEYYSPMTYKYYTFLLSSLICYVKGGFIPHQVFQLGLASSFPFSKEVNKYIGSHKMMTIINALDPYPWWSIQDKGIFYTICQNLELPIPKLYAIIFSNHMSIAYSNNRSLVKKDNLIEFIRNDLPKEFVIKPSNGLRGLFINLYTKTKFGIIDASGDSKTEQEIYASMRNHKRFDSFIVQERLRNHPYLLKVHPSEYLHTIRIITFVNSAGQCKILHGHLNIATGQIIASQQGNLKISISLNDGGLEYGVFVDKKNGGFKKLNEHPETGKDFKEFKLPFWNEIISLSKEAAFRFLPLRTLGWDFAITEKGLKILETNVGYEPPNIFGKMDKIMKTLRDD